jgi:hypothetical protein
VHAESRRSKAALGARRRASMVTVTVPAGLWGAKTPFTARDHSDLQAESRADARHGVARDDEPVSPAEIEVVAGPGLAAAAAPARPSR